MHGISLSPFQIDKARRLARRLKIDTERLEFSVRNFTATGLDAESFDVVWGIESFCHAENKQHFLAEAWRLLRPGGRLVIAEYFLQRRPQSGIESLSLERWLRGWAIPSLATEQDMRDDLPVIGFKEHRIFDITEHIRPSAQEIYRRGHEGFPSDILRKGKNVIQIQHVEACLFQKVCLDLGLWRYQIHSARKPHRDSG